MQEQLLKHGYTIIDVLSPEEATKVSDAAFKRVFDMCFYGKGMGDQLMLTNAKHRHEVVFGYVLNNRNGRSPTHEDVLTARRFSNHLMYDKSTGIVDSYLAPFSLALHLNEKLVSQLTSLYQYVTTHSFSDVYDSIPNTKTNKKAKQHREMKEDKEEQPTQDLPIGYTYGLNPFGVKVADCPESGIILEHSVRISTIQEPIKLNTHVCTSVDLKCPIRNSGCLQVLENAHLYYKVLILLMRDQRLFDARRLDQNLSDNIDSPFFSRFEPYLVVDERFDTILDWLNQQLATYTKIYNGVVRNEEGTDEETSEEVREELSDAINRLSLSTLPWCPREFQPLKWVPVRVNPGQAVVFDTRLLYRTTSVSTSKTNKTTRTPYIYHPISLRIVEDDYYLSNLHGNIRSEMASALFCVNTINNSKIMGEIQSEKERRYMTTTLEPTESIRHYAETIDALTDRDKRLFCIIPYPGLRIHPSRRP